MNNKPVKLTAEGIARLEKQVLEHEMKVKDTKRQIKKLKPWGESYWLQDEKIKLKEFKFSLNSLKKYLKNARGYSHGNIRKSNHI